MGRYWGVYTCRWSSVASARSAIAEYGARCGIYGDDLSDIEVAAGEALIRAAEHGLGHHGFFEVGCLVEGENFVVEIRDSGPGYKGGEEQPRPADECGIGLQLMKCLVDRLTIHDGGSRMRLEKRIRRLLDPLVTLAGVDSAQDDRLVRPTGIEPAT